MERQPIVSGYHDSARIFNFYADRPELYGRRLYSGTSAHYTFLTASAALAIDAPGFAVRAETAVAFLTGGTDAAELARKGVRATTLIAMTWSNDDRSSAYHTPADTPGAVGLDALELAILVGFGLAARIDEGKLG